VLLVGLGKEREFRDKPYLEAVRGAIKVLSDIGVGDATLYLTEVPVKKRDLAWNIEQAVLVAQETLYRFDQMKSKPEEQKKACANWCWRCNVAATWRWAKPPPRAAGHRRRRQTGQGSRQPAGQCLHADLYRRAGQSAGQGIRPRRRGHGTA
jgi:leucyl aminopeptidase